MSTIHLPLAIERQLQIEQNYIEEGLSYPDNTLYPPEDEDDEEDELLY